MRFLQKKTNEIIDQVMNYLGWGLLEVPCVGLRKYADLFLDPPLIEPNNASFCYQHPICVVRTNCPHATATTPPSATFLNHSSMTPTKTAEALLAV